MGGGKCDELHVRKPLTLLVAAQLAQRGVYKTTVSLLLLLLSITHTQLSSNLSPTNTYHFHTNSPPNQPTNHFDHHQHEGKLRLCFWWLQLRLFLHL
jgi:hypothetical protein